MTLIQKSALGPEGLFQPDLFQTERSIADQFPTCGLMSLTDSSNAISSAAYSDGRSHCRLQAGQQTAPSGRVPVLASRSPKPAKAKAPKTNATCGRSSSGSSASVALTRSLASRLKVLLGTDGLMEYQQTWREKATPSGLRYWAHTVRMGRKAIGSELKASYYRQAVKNCALALGARVSSEGILIPEVA